MSSFAYAQTPPAPLKDNSTELFRVSNQTRHLLFHAAEGVVIIPFTFQVASNYIIKVAVMEFSYVFDEQNSLSYSKEITPMARYFRLHMGSYRLLNL